MELYETGYNPFTLQSLQFAIIHFSWKRSLHRFILERASVQHMKCVLDHCIDSVFQKKCLLVLLHVLPCFWFRYIHLKNSSVHKETHLKFNIYWRTWITCSFHIAHYSVPHELNYKSCVCMYAYMYICTCMCVCVMTPSFLVCHSESHKYVNDFFPIVIPSGTRA